MKRLAIVLITLSLAACSGDNNENNTSNNETNNENSQTNNENSQTNNTNSQTNNTNSQTNNENSQTNNENSQTNNTNSGTNNTNNMMDPVVVIENDDCFELENDPDEFALALDGVFGADTQVWRRPISETEMCPADGLTPQGKALTPYVAYRFCNADTVDHLYDFELLGQEGPNAEPPLDDSVLIIYQGEDLPADQTQCLAYNDDIEGAIDAGDSEVLGLNVPAGETVIVVGTTFTYEPDGTGNGAYILIATIADP